MSDKKIMYKTGYGNKIEPVEVVKLTACFVTYIYSWNSRPTESRVSRDGFFDTWDEAKAFLLERAEKKVNSARRTLELARADLGNVKGIKPPTA